MAVVVTGGAGFIGSTLVKCLLESETEIFVVDNFSTGNIKNLVKSDKIKIFKNDIADGMPSLPHVECVYHLGMPSSSPMYLMEHKALCENMVKRAFSNFCNVLDFCRVHDAKLAFASTSSVYNGANEIPMKEDSVILSTEDFYSDVRLYSERLAYLYSDRYGIDAVGLRLFSVYGENERYKGRYANMVSQFIWHALGNKSPVIYGDGSQTRDFIYVEDVVKIFRKAMESKLPKFSIINAGTGIEHSFKDLWDLVCKTVGKQHSAIYTSDFPKHYVKRTCASIEKLKAMLGVQKFVMLEDKIPELVAYYKAN